MNYCSLEMALLWLKNLNMTDSTLLQHCTWLWTYLLHIDYQRVRIVVKIDNDSFICNALGMKGEKGNMSIVNIFCHDKASNRLPLHN